MYERIARVYGDTYRRICVDITLRKLYRLQDCGIIQSERVNEQLNKLRNCEIGLYECQLEDREVSLITKMWVQNLVGCGYRIDPFELENIPRIRGKMELDREIKLLVNLKEITSYKDTLLALFTVLSKDVEHSIGMDRRVIQKLVYLDKAFVMQGKEIAVEDIVYEVGLLRNKKVTLGNIPEMLRDDFEYMRYTGFKYLIPYRMGVDVRTIKAVEFYVNTFGKGDYIVENRGNGILSIYIVKVVRCISMNPDDNPFTLLFDEGEARNYLKRAYEFIYFKWANVVTDEVLKRYKCFK